MGKLAEFVLHPEEFKAAAQLKLFRANAFPRDVASESPEEQRCWFLLKKTSRSFAAVIEELHPELRSAIMLFYLILRALDTVEDDMSIDKSVKLPLLRGFQDKLKLKEWTFDGNAPTEKDRVVLVEFDKILSQFHRLRADYQDVISDITKQMGNGMADYIENVEFNTHGLQTIAEYDLYCHYVAGLVGDGLTRLIILAGFADQKLYDDSSLWNNMGLFLQKTNIIRDYHEDLLDGRSFWPKEIWGKYTDEYANFVKPEHQDAALSCTSELVTNALELVIDVLKYLSALKEDTSFNFCAIPQVMAIATLELVYQNPDVFHKNVKIRKGTTCYLILHSRTFFDVVSVFRYYIRKIHHKSNPRDPNYLRIGELCGKIEQFIEEIYPVHMPEGIRPVQTDLLLQVQRRTELDMRLKPALDHEALKTNMALSIAASVVLLAAAVAFGWIR